MENTISIPLSNIKYATIVLWGDMFNYFIGDGLYLSGNNNYNISYLDFYSNVKNLSSYYPPFSGTPVKYSLITPSKIEFKLPENLIKGDYDIIFCNQAGYYKASKDERFKKLTIY